MGVPQKVTATDSREEVPSSQKATVTFWGTPIVFPQKKGECHLFALGKRVALNNICNLVEYVIKWGRLLTVPIPFLGRRNGKKRTQDSCY